MVTARWTNKPALESATHSPTTAWPQCNLSSVRIHTVPGFFLTVSFHFFWQYRHSQGNTPLGSGWKDLALRRGLRGRPALLGNQAAQQRPSEENKLPVGRGEPGMGFGLLKKLGSLGTPDLKSVSEGEGQSEGTEHVLHQRSSPGDWPRNVIEKSVHQGRTGF